MFDQSSAEKLVAAFINADYHVDDDELVIVPEETIEKDYGWIFFYNSKKYLRTGEISDMLAGNGPVVFEKDSGLMRHTDLLKSRFAILRPHETNTGDWIGEMHLLNCVDQQDLQSVREYMNGQGLFHY